MSNNPLIAKVLSYLPKDAAPNLHQQALTDIIKVFLDLLDEHHKGNPVSWVINAKPGHGKTTAMTSILKYLADQPHRNKVPVLVALRYVPQIEELASTLNKDKPRCAVAISSDNIAEYKDGLDSFQFVIITHARLKSLALSPGHFHESFKLWKSLNRMGDIEFQRGRMLIVDEMPDMVDGAIFDLGALNNAVDWFDTLAADRGLPDEERILARCIIMLLLAKEFAENKEATNRALATISPEAQRLVEAIGKLPTSGPNVEALSRMKWFNRLLKEPGIARLYVGREGRRLLAAQKVDYAKLGVPLLIMDGTADVTETFYMGYDLKAINNYTQPNRLHLHWRRVNTTKRVREKAGKTTQATIAKDIQALVQQGLHPFPITAKDDFGTYKSKGVITPAHEACFDYTTEAPEISFHLRNLAGSNRLNDQSALYLTSLPIMHPDAYRLMAFAIFGPVVSLELSDRKDEGWFSDPLVEMIYCQWLTAELLQLIYRSAFRNILSIDPVSVYMAHNLKWVSGLLQDQLGLPEENLTDEMLFNGSFAGFESKVRKFGQEARNYFDKEDSFNGQASVRSVAYWFNRLLENSSGNEAKLAEANAILLDEFDVEVRRDHRNVRMVWDRKTP